MAQVIISQLPPLPNGTGSGSSQGTDLFPATDVTDTSSASTGTTKKYTLSEIQQFLLTAQGLTTYTAVQVATTTDLTVTYNNGTLGVGATVTNADTQAALAIDGVTLAVGARVLIKNQISNVQNGIYTVTNIGSGSTNWIMTRSTDYDTPSEIVQYGVVLSNQGTTNAGLLWQETGAGPWTIGTTPIIFSAYSSSSLVNSITGTANQVLVDGTTGIPEVGALTLSLPQSIATSSTPTFLGLTAGNLNLLNNTLSSINTNGTINLVPNGTGSVLLKTTSSYNAIYTSSTQAVGPISSLRLGDPAPAASFMGFATNSTIQGTFSAIASGRTICRMAGYADDGTQFVESGLMQWLSVAPISTGIVPCSWNLYTANTSGTRTLALSMSEAQVLTLTNALLPASGGLGTSTAPSAGQIPIGTSGGVYTPAAINSGTGIVVANSSGSITISATGGGLSWSTSSGTSVSTAINNGYISGNAAQSTFTLPATAAIGSVVAIEGLGAGGWILAANTGQTIKIGTSTTSSAGSLTSAAASDNVYVTCIVADLTWRVRSTNSTGLTVA